MSKKEQLALIEGYETFYDLLCVYEDQVVVPGICVNKDCNFTKNVSPLDNKSHCSYCNTDSVHSLHMLIAKNVE